MAGVQGLRGHRTLALLLILASCAVLAASASAAAATTIVVTPGTAKVAAGAKQTFTAKVSGSPVPSLVWMVNGHVGGGSAWGTITSRGVYTAPAIDPGMAVTVSAASSSNTKNIGNATVTVVNPPTPRLTGATYAAELANWEAVLLPGVENNSGLTWDDTSRTWTPTPNWTPPSYGIGPLNYYQEMFLRPATRMAIAKQDIALMEELATFHLAMLQWRTTTVGTMIQNGGTNPYVFLSGPSSARTFPWYEPCPCAWEGPGTQMEVTEDEQSNAQYLSQAAQLLRAIAEMPAAQRSSTLLDFVQEFSGFLVSEQLLRVLYGTTPWAHWQNPNIPQPVVSGWTFLAQSGYRPPHPITYQAAMTDTELWLVADAAEVLGADAAAPELGILNSSTRAQLQQAVLAGASLMQARCHHEVSPDGADVLSAFAGDLDDHPSRAYSGDTGPNLPTTPNPKYGLSWDVSHAYRFPIVFRSLYETRRATGATFPTLNDLVALTNTYLHLALTGTPQLPGFTNFFDGWNGWFDVGDPSVAGYPPQQYCNSTLTPDNCLTAGAVQGWGQLAFANPELGTLMQNVINLAYDTSAADQSFITQYYYYGGPYVVSGNQYPCLMIWVAGDSAERFP